MCRLIYELAFFRDRMRIIIEKQEKKNPPIHQYHLWQYHYINDVYNEYDDDLENFAYNSVSLRTRQNNSTGAT